MRGMRITMVAAGMLLCAAPLMAMEEYTVRGKVTDREGEPLTGATVMVRGDEVTGAVTDTAGHYEVRLTDDKEHTLVVQYIGYMTQSRTVRPGGKGREDFRLTENSVGLDQVVVTGTRTPKTLMDAPIATKVITLEEIKRVDATNVSELLQQELPGLELSFSMGQNVTLSMSGFGGNSVLFLVDGERLAGETLDNVDFSRLNLDDVERIEIVKGAASSLYGSNAVGGVINIITRQSSEPWSVNLNARYGAHNEFRTGGTVGFNVGRVSNTINAQWSGIDSYAMRNEGDFGDYQGNRTLNVKERLVYTPVDGLKLTARVGYYQRELDYSELVKNRYRDLNGGVRGNWEIDKRSNLEVSYAYDEYNKSNYMMQSGKDILDYVNTQHNVRALYNCTFAGKHTLTVGGDFLNDYLLSYQFAEGDNVHQQYTADVFAQFDWTVVKNFNIIGGVRYDYFSDKDVHSVSPKLGLMYKIEDATAGHYTFRGSYAKGFRAPTLKEMYMNFDMASIFNIYGNPNLKPEQSHNFSLSAEWFKSYFNLTATGYFNMVDQSITNVWSNELHGMVYDNASPTRMAGFDAVFAMRLPCGFGTKVSYAYTYEFTTDGSPLMTSTRPHALSARVEYGRDWKNYGFNIALSGRWLSAYTTATYADGGYEELIETDYPGYTIWKLTLSQSVWRGIDVNIVVDNLFNYVPKYYYNNSPVTNGTTLAAGVSLNIEEMVKRK